MHITVIGIFSKKLFILAKLAGFSVSYYAKNFVITMVFQGQSAPEDSDILEKEHLCGGLALSLLDVYNGSIVLMFNTGN